MRGRQKKSVRVILITKNNLLYQLPFEHALRKREDALDVVGILSIKTKYPAQVKKSMDDAMREHPVHFATYSLTVLVASVLVHFTRFIGYLLEAVTLGAYISPGKIKCKNRLVLEDLKAPENIAPAANFMRACHCHLLLSCGAPVIPDELLSIPSIAAVNMHAAYLPGLGGGSTDIRWFTDAVQRAEDGYGVPCAVCTHLMLSRVDEGDLLAVKILPSPSTCIEYMLKVMVHGPDLAARTCAQLVSKQAVSCLRVKQKSRGPYYYRRGTFNCLGEVVARHALSPRFNHIVWLGRIFWTMISGAELGNPMSEGIMLSKENMGLPFQKGANVPQVKVLEKQTPKC